MSFSKVPAESKSKIKKAGQILIESNPDTIELTWARDLANRWRACHAYPINTFQSTLRSKLRAYSKDAIVAQRLKRMPTIIDKLKRYPSMQLTTMQDIGGIRVVLRSLPEVKKLVNEYKKNSRFIHELVDENNYIENPRSEDGYRSWHLIYKYRNKRNPDYDGLRLELQIRTRLQHLWATAVETMGTFLGQALKSRQGEQEWLDFFALTSAAFAHQEKTPPIPRFSNLTPMGTLAAVAIAESRLGALEKMSGISVAIQLIQKKPSAGEGGAYHLIVLNSLEKTVKVRAYAKEKFNQAMADYSAIEKEVVEGKKLEPVLVSAGPIGNLRKAFPNFFLDINDFTQKVRNLVSPK